MEQAQVQWVGSPRDSSDLDEKRATTAGVAATLAWLKKHDVAPYRFAFDNGIDQSAFRRLLAGERKSVSVTLALKIEKGTGGEVPVAAWGV